MNHIKNTQIGYKKKSRLKKNLIIDSIFMIIYKLSIDITYIYAISPYYSSVGMVFNPAAYKYMISWILFLTITPFIINLYDKEKSSAIIVLLINLIYFIPGCTLYALAGLDDLYFIFYFVYWILFMFWHYKMPKIRIKTINKNSKFIFNLIIIFTVLGSIIVTGLYNDFKLNFSLANVYTLRSEVSEMDLPLLMGYFRPLAASIIPIGIVHLLKNKKYFLSILLIFTQLLLFAFGGHKTVFFMIFIAIFAFVFFRNNNIRKITPVLILLNVLAIFDTYLRKNVSFIAAFLQRRNMFTPNLLSNLYYDFFSKNKPDFLKQSILRLIGFNSDYDIAIPHLIAITYYGRDFGANNGMIGDAFANFRWLGLIIYPILFAVVFRIFDACSKKIDRRILITASVIITINFVNSSFFTVLLTHAFLFICLTLYFYPRSIQS